MDDCRHWRRSITGAVACNGANTRSISFRMRPRRSHGPRQPTVLPNPAEVLADQVWQSLASTRSFPLQRRMAPLRKHAAFLVLLLVVAPLMVSFTAHDGIATVGDDSVSYLTLARNLAGTAGPFLAPWVGEHANFPPLFPIALALSGGAEDLRIAHLVVALFAIAALAMVYAYGLLQFSRPVAAMLLAAAFVMTPTAWISVKGILSESMFLFLSLAAICFYERRLAPSAPRRTIEWISFGLLLAAVYLTRAAGIALLAAYAVHALVRAARESGAVRWKLALPPIIAVAVIGLWIATRPTSESDAYAQTLGKLLKGWRDDTGVLLLLSARLMAGGWIATFTSEAEVSLVSWVVFGALGALALAGSIRRALANRLDGWYVLASTVMLFLWIFQEDNQRRLLYPLVPLLLAHAAQAAMATIDRLAQVPRRLILTGAALAPALVCLPATVLVAQRSQDRQPLIDGGRYAAADITDYYTTINSERARSMAAKQAAVLYGLERLRDATPDLARVMWLRPEYVALLGGRQSVPYFHGSDARALADAIRIGGATHVVLATLYKTDLRHAWGDPLPVLLSVFEYARPVYSVQNAVTGAAEFTLVEIDAEALAAFLAKRS